MKNVSYQEKMDFFVNLAKENPDVSLQELGGMLKNPIGKSGVNHRLKAIEQIAESKMKSRKVGEKC